MHILFEVETLPLEKEKDVEKKKRKLFKALWISIVLFIF